jgi:hypothetical protein
VCKSWVRTIALQGPQLPECSLYVPWMCTECSLNVSWMFAECSLNVPWMFPKIKIHFYTIWLLHKNSGKTYFWNIFVIRHYKIYSKPQSAHNHETSLARLIRVDRRWISWPFISDSRATTCTGLAVRQRDKILWCVQVSHEGRSREGMHPFYVSPTLPGCLENLVNWYRVLLQMPLHFWAFFLQHFAML